MNRYDIGWRESMRLRYGLTWRKTRPTWEDVTESILDTLFLVLVLIAVVCLFGWLDARDAKIAAEIEANKSSQQFADFLNGGTIINDTETFAARCTYLLEVTN